MKKERQHGRQDFLEISQCGSHPFKDERRQEWQLEMVQHRRKRLLTRGFSPVSCPCNDHQGTTTLFVVLVFFFQKKQVSWGSASPESPHIKSCALAHPWFYNAYECLTVTCRKHSIKRVCFDWVRERVCWGAHKFSKFIIFQSCTIISIWPSISPLLKTMSKNLQGESGGSGWERIHSGLVTVTQI